MRHCVHMDALPPGVGKLARFALPQRMGAHMLRILPFLFASLDCWDENHWDCHQPSNNKPEHHDQMHEEGDPVFKPKGVELFPAPKALGSRLAPILADRGSIVVGGPIVSECVLAPVPALKRTRSLYAKSPCTARRPSLVAVLVVAAPGQCAELPVGVVVADSVGTRLPRLTLMGEGATAVTCVVTAGLCIAMNVAQPVAQVPLVAIRAHSVKFSACCWFDCG